MAYFVPFARVTQPSETRASFQLATDRKGISTMAQTSSADNYSERWEIMWNGGNHEYEVKNGDGGSLKPGQAFDAGRSCPHLEPFLKQKKHMLVDTTAVIPGCGRGYDVETFAKYCKEVTGIELAQTAVVAAKEYLGDKHDNAQVIQGNFLEDSGNIEVQYDVGYDYTFFCALHPDMRDNWAKAWSKTIQKGGILITSMFPVLPEDSRDQTGPPWPVWPDLYTEHLQKYGFTLESLEKVPHDGSHPGREGKEYLGVWKRT